MKFCTRNGDELTVTVWGLDAYLPLIRDDSEARPVAGDLWAVFTPSTGASEALLLGTETACKNAIKDYAQ